MTAVTTETIGIESSAENISWNCTAAGNMTAEIYNATTLCWRNLTLQELGEDNLTNLICCNVENEASYDQHLLNLMKVHIIMSCICIAFVTITLSLLLRFKHGNSKRATIHANLLAAFFIYAVVIKFFLLAVYLQVVHGIGNAISMMCVSAISRHYTLVSVYTWMLIEGIYLHVLVTTPFKVEKIPTHVFYLFGWGLPLVCILCWSILTAKQTDGCSQGWTDLTMFTYILILCPILFILLINFLMLLNLLRIVVTKLCRDRVSECQRIWQSIKATVVLTFLLGIINVSLIPVDDIKGPGSYIASMIPYLQVIFVCGYILTNSEMRKSIQRWWLRYKDSRLMPSSGARIPLKVSSFTKAVTCHLQVADIDVLDKNPTECLILDTVQG